MTKFNGKISEAATALPDVSCNFCGRAKSEVSKLIASPDNKFICNDCVVVCLEICEVDKLLPPIPLLMICPMCRKRHIDEGEFATRPHHTHACQGCGHVWRPALVATVGVKFLPGFKDVKAAQSASYPPVVAKHITAEQIQARIAEIDVMFESATDWGSWMSTASSERKHLVNRLRDEFKIDIPHRYEKRRSV